MAKVLVADDEHGICQAFSQFLKIEGHESIIASNGNEALKLTYSEQPDAVFLDVQMPGMGGLETLEKIHSDFPNLPVMVMTAYGTMQTAMDAMRLGAFDYIGKPIELAQVRVLLERALHKPDQTSISKQRTPAEQRVAQQDELIGQSASMQEIFKLMGLLTTNDLTVLITGESGVGKELVARGIHFHSTRKNEPFIAVNCAAIPEQLLESELFGHEKGAFTDAKSRRIGRFEASGEGSLFLDEVGELPLHLQSKLLRVLQERSFERVGDVTPIPVKSRLIAASNKKLDILVEQGQFREDLYHRLKLVTLDIPPLRKRMEDLEALIHHFINQANMELGKQVKDIDSAALDRLYQHSWPGNIRELEHAIKRSILLARGPVLTVHDLEFDLPAEQVDSGTSSGTALNQLRAAIRKVLRQKISTEKSSTTEENSVFHELVSVTEKELIEEALHISQGNQVAASKLLGLHRTTMRKKMSLKPED